MEGVNFVARALGGWGKGNSYKPASRAKRLDSREGGAEGGFKGGIPRRPSG